MKVIYLKAQGKFSVPIGSDTSIKVNCNVGINSITQRQYEIKRINEIALADVQPDMFMDLSTIYADVPIYKELMKIFKDKPIGSVPSYLLFTLKSKETPIDVLKRQADDGISFFTLHLTANRDLYSRANAVRRIPCTSRGGGMVMKYAYENVWMKNLTQIIDIAKSYNIAISLGTTFRPAAISDACDEVHIEETNEQLKICKLLQKEGVNVIVENVGHIDLSKLRKHCVLLRMFNAPIMPLGPTPTDNAIELDDIAAAIGASHMGFQDAAHIINCITASEHSKSMFSIKETLQAIRVAKLTAHIIDVAKGINRDLDNEIYEQRAARHSCVTGTESCSRCSTYCPLRIQE